MVIALTAAYALHMSGKSSPAYVTEYIRDWIHEQRATIPQPTWVALGVQLGCGHANVINIHKGAGVGAVVEEAFARLKFGGSVDALRAAAKAYAEERAARMWPNLAEAMQLRGAKWSHKTLTHLARIGASWPMDRSVGQWLDDGDRIEVGQSNVRQRSAGMEALRAEAAAADAHPPTQRRPRQ